MPQVRQLVRDTGAEATASAWNGSRTRWAAGTADGTLQIWERCDDGAERGPLTLAASWPLGGSGGEKTATAAHLVWVPQEFGSKLAVACRGSSRVHIWGEVGGAGEGEGGEDGGNGWRRGDGREGGADQSGAGREGEGGGGGYRRGGGNRWRLVGVVDVGSMLLSALNGAASGGGVNGGGFIPSGGMAATSSSSSSSLSPSSSSSGAAVLALAFVRSTYTDPLLLLAVTSEGRMVVHRCSDCLTLSDWTLEADVALFPYADVSMGQELLSRAIIAVHPSTRVSGQSPAVAIATCAAGNSKGDCSTAKVWVRSDRYMRWHAIADLLPNPSANPSTNQQATPVSSIAWAPTLDRPFDVVALAAASAVHLARIDYPNLSGSAQFAEPDGALDAMEDGAEARSYRSRASKALVQVRHVARLTSTSACQVHQVSWDLLGSSIAAVGADGVVTVWKQTATGKWAGHSVYSAK
ncbi:hypothetical protein CLOM_g4961 [Closterium sp. NIES-68]|nr:hypothetical protein CLOM_g4961 [Closterium sp. NIES-68]